MKYRLILISCLLSCICFAQKRPLKEEDFPPTFEHYLDKNSDTQRYAFFAFDSKRDNSLFNNTYKPSTLSIQELKNIEKLINKETVNYNSKTKGRKIVQPDKYYKQFIVVKNINGQKEVWINCCCSVMKEYWKKEIQLTRDGGSCFFQLKVNLTKNLVYDFWVNGVA